MKKVSMLIQRAAVFCFVIAILLIPLSAQAGQAKNTSSDPFERPEEQEQGTLTLKVLLQQAREHNPAIQAAELAAQAKRALIIPAKTLPDPSVVVQSMGDPIPGKLMRGDPSSARTIGVEQEFPFPGKLGLKGKIATIEADQEELNHTQTHLTVVSELKQSFYELYVIRKSMELLRNSRDFLQQLSETAEAKYRAGQGAQQDAMKAQLELSKVLDRMLTLDRQRKVSEIKINTLLHRSPATPVGKPAEFQKAELTQTLDQLKQLARAGATELKIQEREIERKEQSLKLANKEYYPDFSVGFTYYDREAQPEMYAWMIKVKVPLYSWRKQRNEVQSAKLSVSSAQKMQESTAVSIDSRIEQYYVTASTAERLMKLYAAVVVPQANGALNSSLASYRVGKVEFLSVLDNVTASIDYQQKYYESIGEFHKALAQMEPLVGIDLTL